MDAVLPQRPRGYRRSGAHTKPDLIVHKADRPETVRACLKVLVRAQEIYSTVAGSWSG